MKKLVQPISGLCLLLCSLGSVSAQEAMGPPKVLVVQREFVKPGKSGSLHEKSESAFVKAMTAAKWPEHYIALDSMSGVTRSLFLNGYDSFEAWEKDVMAFHNNKTLSATVDSASIVDGDLLTSFDQSVYRLREELSLRTTLVDVAHIRFFEITRMVVKPGHEREFATLAKMYVKNYEKTVPDAHWDTFESIYGADNGGIYLVITLMKSLSETDKGFGDSDKFSAALGESDRKVMRDLSQSCIESSQTNIFMINPKMSYPTDRWVKEDTAFWGSK